MLLCPETVEACQRAGCTPEHCERTQESLLAVCWQCGVVTFPHSSLGICVECVRGYAPNLNNGA